MDVAMWRRAVTSVPKLDKPAWDGLDPIARWLIATRSAVLVMTVLSALIAGILAWREAAFDPWLFLLVTVGLIAAHAVNNLLNDLTDHWTGADRGDAFRTRYGVQPVEDGLMSARRSLLYVAGTATFALAAGIALVVVRGLPVLWLLGAGVFFAVFYTWPLKHIGLGEPAVLVVWGPLMIGGGFYVITGQWSWPVVLAGLPYALGVTTVLLGKHIDKLPFDRGRGIRTVPVLIGDPTARALVLGLIGVQYALVAYLVVRGFLGWPVLVVLGAAPLLRHVWTVYRNPKPDRPPAEYPPDAWPLWFVSFAFVHNRRFGALYLVGLIVDAGLTRLL